MIKKIMALAFAASLFLFSAACGDNTSNAESGNQSGNNQAEKRFDTVGLYVWDDVPAQHSYWKACGIDTLVFCDRGWWINADNLDAYLAKLTMWIDSAHRSGFKAYVLLFSNIEQYKGPEATEPTGLGIKFHPNDDEKLQERLFFLEKTIAASAKAEGFTLLAGDPGGISNDMGPGKAQDFIKLAREIKNLVLEKAPDADFNINTWAISYYYTPNQNTGASKFWTNETEMTRELIAAGLIDENAGIEFPTHDYYRPLTLRAYYQLMKNDDTITEYPLYPLKGDIDALKAKKVKNIWSWPYFLMDEADDGDPGGGTRTTLPQLESRYIYSYLDQMEKIGMNGVIGNWSSRGYKNKSLNTYAFGRFANDASATIDQVYKEYAAFVATAETQDSLVEILKFIENDSNWQKKLPKEKRLEDFKVNIETPQQALEKLAEVKANPAPEVLIPDGPAKLLENLKKRLELMVETF